jgi:6-phosphogluconate dehydrogenase (decarboxylating)
VIRSWLVELMEKGLGNVKDLKEVPDYIEDMGGQLAGSGGY